MASPTPLMDRLVEALEMTADLLDDLSEDELGRSLQEPSNTIWDQLWCVVGARESHVRAIQAGEWAGFSCSLTGADRGSKARLAEALASSRDALIDTAGTGGTYVEESLLDLLLHETQHQGQLIRFMYGLELEFPESWHRRWNV